MLEGRKAVSLPLRFSDGAVFLGPVPLGVIPADITGKRVEPCAQRPSAPRIDSSSRPHGVRA